MESGFLPRFGADCLKAEMPSAEERIIGSADRTFQDFLEVDLGHMTARMEHIGGTHTADSSLLYIPERRVVFAGDCLYGRRFNGAYGYRLEELISMTRQLEGYEADHYLISHEPPYSREALLKLLHRLIEVGRIVGDETDRGRAEGAFRQQTGHPPDEEEREMMGFFLGPNAACL